MSALFQDWIAESSGGAAVAEPPALFTSPIPADDCTRVACPHCGKRCKLPAGARLDRARCPKCSERITAPVKPAEPIAEPLPVLRPVAPLPPLPEVIPVAESPPLIPPEEPPAPVPVKRRGKLVDIYRPRSISELSGQDWARDVLTEFLANPQSGAFLFSGPTGTGKTSAALALAADLGVAVEFAECGGLHVIASGEQTGETVKAAVNALWCRPMMGSGWKVLVVNEADCITSNAAFKWLDVLEDLPPRSVVIFTTNDASKLPRRLRDRCEEVQFVGGALVLRAACEALARRVWTEQTGRNDCPPLDSFGAWAVDGEASFRRLLQLMEPYVRVAKARGEILPLCLDMVDPDESVKRKRK